MKALGNETYFPLSLAGEVIEILRSRGAEFKRYCDFPVPLYVSSPWLDRAAYMLEGFPYRVKKYPIVSRIQSFIGRVITSPSDVHKSGTKGFPPIAILHHDADQVPENTLRMMQYESQMGVVSSAFFFYQQNGAKEPEHYSLDVVALQDLEAKGFEIGYHLNAYELAGYDLHKATELIERDIDWFAQRFELRCFLPHGGVRGPNGEDNHLIPYRGVLRRYNWVYNGRGLYCNHNWSDGNIGFETVQDPRVVAARVLPGQRARFLMHPQYYGDELSPSYRNLPVSNETWWRDLWGV
jgi:hypothetical protein